MKPLLALLFLLAGCASKVEQLPPTCSFASESVRQQLCMPDQPVLILCTNTAQTDPHVGECTGPHADVLSHPQESGNGWCCR